MCKPVYPGPGNREGRGRMGVQHKNTFGCMAGLTLALICVAAASGHTVRGVSDGTSD